MIEETYCSFEVAKLLKEKGFDEKKKKKYDDTGYLSLNNVGYINSEKPSEDFYALAPTQQMAMKWLREVHYLWIDIDPLTNHKWTWSIWFMNDPKLKMGESSQVISTYEDAVEASLAYVLENLI